MAFYNNFISLCNSVNKSPTAVILEIGLERSSGTRWKKGGLPSDATALRIADYFKITISDLMGDKESPAENDEASLQPIAPHELELLNYIRSRPPEEQPAACQDAEAFLRFRAEKK